MRRSGAAFLILSLLGCGGGGAADLTQPSQVSLTLTVNPTTATVAVGGVYSLAVTPKDQFGNPVPGMPTPTFSSSDPTKATADASGLVTGVAAGTATITASITVAGVTYRATCVVTVTAGPPAGNEHDVTTVATTFNPATITIAVNDTVTWYFAGAVHNVTFNGAAPPAGNIPDQQPGSIVSRVFPTAGTYDYECTRHAGMVGHVVVQSGTAAVYSSLSVAPATPAVLVGGTLQLTTTPLDQNGSGMAGLPAPTFSSSAPATATVGSTGLVTAVAAGTATITASLTANGATHTATATVTVTAPQSNAVTVTTPSQTFSPSTVTIPAGGTVTWQFSGATHNVTFTGAAPSGGNIPDTSPGNAVSRTFPTAGRYDYECTRHGGMTGTVVVQAGGGGSSLYTSLSVTPATAAVTVSGTVQLTASALDQYGSAMAGLPAATFTSGDPAVATVSGAGVVTGVSSGTATITASLTAAGGSHTATSVITVTTSEGGTTTVTTSGSLFTPERVYIAPGGTVTWAFSGTHNVTFTGPVPPGGNIPDTAAGNSVSRTFPAAGDYDYVCTRHDGMKGRVRVQ
jgi:plastocyanin